MILAQVQTLYGETNILSFLLVGVWEWPMFAFSHWGGKSRGKYSHKYLDSVCKYQGPEVLFRQAKGNFTKTPGGDWEGKHFNKMQRIFQKDELLRSREENTSLFILANMDTSFHKCSPKQESLFLATSLNHQQTLYENGCFVWNTILFNVYINNFELELSLY